MAGLSSECLLSIPARDNPHNHGGGDIVKKYSKPTAKPVTHGTVLRVTA